MSPHISAARAALVLGLLVGAPLAHARPEAGLHKQANISYGTTPEQVLDIWRPQTPGPHKLIVFLHGGGWTKGNKNAGHNVAPALTEAGYLVASIEYRHVPETTPGGAVSDAAHGIAYLLTNAAQLGIDPAHFALIGHSSGAHMVALLGTDGRYLQAVGVNPNRLAAVVTLDGVFDVDANITDYPTEGKIAVFGNDPAQWKQISPVDLLDSMKVHPQFCLVHEDRVPRFVEQEALFEKALKQHGEKVEAITAPGLSHGELLGDFSDDQQPIKPFVLSCLQKVLPAH